MKRTKFRFIWFTAVLAALAAIMFYARKDSTSILQKNSYKEWQQHFVVAGQDYAYVKTSTDKDKDIVLSEAQGYGMLIAVDAAEKGQAQQTDFEKLYRYYLSHREGETQLMSWRQTVIENQVSTEANNATDGDLYIAYSLIKAAKQWPKKSDEYLQQAQAILQDILTYNYNSEQKILTVGNWAAADSKFHNLVRTSDILPAQFQAFYDLTGNQDWLTIKDSMLSKLETVSRQYETGLIPDFIWVDGDSVSPAAPNDISTENDGDYSYNACRLPYNLAQSKDDKSQKIVTKMLDFFMEEDSIKAGYSLEGQPLNQYQASSFSAPVFYAANKNNDYRKLVQQNKYIFMTELSSENYYEAALVTLVALESL
ncbi:glycosyl hydrolase family 8 [Streptococcus sp. H49]|uniref:glycosyl hydrolase family 8 n=1 Tax=Streptococcus huangxiaojuni TaxID=3237239 RepID=UPI0034A13C3D